MRNRQTVLGLTPQGDLESTLGTSGPARGSAPAPAPMAAATPWPRVLDQALEAPCLRAWLGLAVGALMLAGLFALAIAMTRTPAVQLLVSPQAFYVALVTHVTFALTVWLLAGLCVVALVVARLAGVTVNARLARIGVMLGGLGVGMVTLAGFLGLGQPYLNDFVPVLDHPVFYVGLALFVAGGVAVLVGFLAGYPRWRELTPEGMGILVASLSILLALGLLALAGQRLAGVPIERALWLKVLFWAPGQAILFADTALMATLWILLLRLVHGELGFSARWARLALFGYLPFLFIIVSVLLSGHPLVLFSQSRWLVNSLGGVGLLIPSVMLGVLVGRQLLRAPARRWREPAFAGLVLSLALYAVGGAIAGAGFRSDLRVPAHYHGTVGALTIALMALCPYLVERRPVFSRWATIQPYLYGLGLLIMMVGLYWAGILGAPRKTFGFDWANLPALIAMNVMGVGALLAVTGGVVFGLRMLNPLLGWHRVRPPQPAAAEPPVELGTVRVR